MNPVRVAGAALIGLMGLTVSVASGQTQNASGLLPSFEVATIRPWKPRPIPPGTPPPMRFDPSSSANEAPRTDRVHLIGEATILIGSAYNVPPAYFETRIVGGPDWARSQDYRYEVQAKIDAQEFAAMQTMTPEQRKQRIAGMEQALLADRFKLKVHSETRELPAYLLVVAKGGPKLTPAKEGEPTMMANTHASEQGTETKGTAITLDQFAHSLLLFGGRTVVNQTGLKGAYDFTLTYAREQPDVAAGASDAPPLFTAIQEQLGLRVVPSKAPVEVIVIDSIDRPSEN